MDILKVIKAMADLQKSKTNRYPGILWYPDESILMASNGTGMIVFRIYKSERKRLNLSDTFTKYVYNGAILQELPNECGAAGKVYEKYTDVTGKRRFAIIKPKAEISKREYFLLECCMRVTGNFFNPDVFDKIKNIAEYFTDIYKDDEKDGKPVVLTDADKDLYFIVLPLMTAGVQRV